MLGLLFGTVCLIGLFKVVRGSRYGYGGHWHGGGHFGRFGGGPCGRRAGWAGWGGGPRGYGRSGGWADDGDGDDVEDFAPWERGGGGAFFGLRALFARLDTTHGQEKAIRAAFDELRAKVRAVKEDARGMRGDLAGALRGESLDAETLGTVASRASNSMDAVRDAGIGAVLKVHEVLDERQRAIVADLIESGPRFGRGWRGRGGPFRSNARNESRG